MNYYISHSTALANNLTAISYLSHLMIYFFSLRRFSNEESDLGLFRSQSVVKFWLLLRVEEHRTRHQNGMGKRVKLSLIYDKCMQPGSRNKD